MQSVSSAVACPLCYLACIRAIIPSLGDVLCPPFSPVVASQPDARWQRVSSTVAQTYASLTLAHQTKSDGQSLSNSSSRIVKRSSDHDMISMGVLDAALPPTARRWWHKMINVKMRLAVHCESGAERLGRDLWVNSFTAASATLQPHLGEVRDHVPTSEGMI